MIEQSKFNKNKNNWTAQKNPTSWRFTNPKIFGIREPISTEDIFPMELKNNETKNN